MRKFLFVLLPFVALTLVSCESEEERISKALNTYLRTTVPYNAGVEVTSFTPLREDAPTRHFSTDVSFIFTEKGDSLIGHGQVTIVFDNEKKSILGHVSYPNYITLNEKLPYRYTIISSETANAYNYSKRMVKVRIYEYLQEEALKRLSEYLVYEQGLFQKHINISYYADGMSLNGPNYAFCDVNVTSYSYECKTEFNSIVVKSIETEQTPSVSQVNKQAPYAGSTIIGTWQFVGPSKMTIYQKNGAYYMVTEEAGTYSTPDKLVKLTYKGYPSFKYVEDTGEIFSIRADGLYGYANGDLSSVFNNL